MTPELFQKIEEIFYRVRQFPVADRNPYLDQACSGDEELRTHVEEMLNVSDLTYDPLSSPLAALGLRAIAGEQDTTNPQEGWVELEQFQNGDTIVDTYRDRYECKGVIGQGGMGQVYHVVHEKYPIDIAMKVASSRREQHSSVLTNEASVWLNLGPFPHIVSCFYRTDIKRAVTYDTSGYKFDFLAIFAEFVNGGSLSQLIHSGRLYQAGADESLRSTLDLAIQMAWGLHEAHEHGVVHMDVKPGNVMITLDGVAKVTDFGSAQTRTSTVGDRPAELGRSILVPGIGCLTPAYCSPEQARGEALTRGTDIWSWGLVVLEIFAGEAFWAKEQYSLSTGLTGTSAAASLDQYLETREGFRLEPTIMPAELANLLRRCFQTGVRDRLASMDEISGELEQIYYTSTGERYPRKRPSPASACVNTLQRSLAFVRAGKKFEALLIKRYADRTYSGRYTAT